MEREENKYMKYNKKAPRITIRLPNQESKERIIEAAERAGKSVSEHVLPRILEGTPASGQPGGQTTASGGQTTKQDQARADFLFMFTFFNKNAPVLSVSDEERTTLKQIMARAKQL